MWGFILLRHSLGFRVMSVVAIGSIPSGHANRWIFIILAVLTRVAPSVWSSSRYCMYLPFMECWIQPSCAVLTLIYVVGVTHLIYRAAEMLLYGMAYSPNIA